METTRKWRFGVNRWVVLLLIVLQVVFASLYPPIRPHIQVAPEQLSDTPLFTLPVIGSFYMTNTLWGMVFVDVIVLAIVLLVAFGLRRNSLIPRGLAAAMEMAVEMLYNLAESTAGKAVKKIFPWFATIVIVVLIANFTELIPMVDSVGKLEPAEHGYTLQQFFPWLAAIVQGQGNYAVTPYVRTLSTDLNFTFALALIAVVMTQIIGVRSQGLAYFSKFFNTRTMFTTPIFGAIDFLVSLLELISEFSKILSFGFRLFGNIFAGSVLLFLVGSLVPVFAQSMILFFEFVIGLIQAFVFGMLTLVFMSQATVGHISEEHHE